MFADVEINEDGSVTCPKCGRVIHPEATQEIGEEGGYMADFQDGDVVFCGGCGAQMEIQREEPHDAIRVLGDEHENEQE